MSFQPLKVVYIQCDILPSATKRTSRKEIEEVFGISPTGRRIKYAGAALFRFEEEKLLDGCFLGNTKALMKQLTENLFSRDHRECLCLPANARGMNPRNSIFLSLPIDTFQGDISHAGPL